MYDFAVIGGGVAGCSIAYFLSKNAKKVALFDAAEICSGASGAAGAFINPTMGKPSALKAFSDEAFKFSTNYFSANFPDLFDRCGTYLLPKTEKSIDEFRSLEAYVDFDYEFILPNQLGFLTNDAAKYGAFLCKDSGVLPPKDFCERLVDGCDLFLNTKIDTIEAGTNGYSVGKIQAKTVILATGAKTELLTEDYLTKSVVGLWGQKIVVQADSALCSNISGEVLVSAEKDSKVAIGATYIRSKLDLPLSSDASNSLIVDAKNMINLNIFDVVDTKGGLRSTSVDHFPIVGQIIDSEKTIQENRSVLNGRKLKKEQISYFENLYVFTGHTSKAFSVAFYSAKLFADYLAGDALSGAINSDRLFFRWCRKIRD